MSLPQPALPKGAPPSLPSFPQLYAEQSPFVWRTLRRLGVREADLEDVCQEAFMIVHRRLPEFEGRSKLGTWLFGICVRLASDYRRRAYNRRETAVSELPDGALPPEQVELVARRQARARLDAILDALDEDKRTVFVLFELEQWPMTQVSEAVGCPVQTAYARLYAARQKVQEALNRARAEGGGG
jgi:RNA polymerase sigma-70 factor, ECF subfamily